MHQEHSIIDTSELRPPSGPTLDTAAETRRETLEHWAVESVAGAAARFLDFVHYGNPHIAAELECFLIETGSVVGVEELMTDVADALVVIGDMRTTGRSS